MFAAKHVLCCSLMRQKDEIAAKVSVFLIVIHEPGLFCCDIPYNFGPKSMIFGIWLGGCKGGVVG